MSVTPSSTARRRTRRQASGSAGSLHAPLADKAHGAVAEAIDGEIAAELEDAACGGDGGHDGFDAIRIVRSSWFTVCGGQSWNSLALGRVWCNAGTRGATAMSAAAYPNSNAQAIFYQQYEAVRRDEVVGILLALFLGTLACTTSTCGAQGWGFSTAAFSGRGSRRFSGSSSAFLCRGGCGSSTRSRRRGLRRRWA